MPVAVLVRGDGYNAEHTANHSPSLSPPPRLHRFPSSCLVGLLVPGALLSLIGRPSHNLQLSPADPIAFLVDPRRTFKGGSTGLVKGLRRAGIMEPPTHRMMARETTIVVRTRQISCRLRTRDKEQQRPMTPLVLPHINLPDSYPGRARDLDL